MDLTEHRQKSAEVYTELVAERENQLNAAQDVSDHADYLDIQDARIEAAHRNRLGLLLALQRKPHVYAGTASPTKVAKRRAKNRVAKQSRKVNR